MCFIGLIQINDWSVVLLIEYRVNHWQKSALLFNAEQQDIGDRDKVLSMYLTEQKWHYLHSYVAYIYIYTVYPHVIASWLKTNLGYHQPLFRFISLTLLTFFNSLRINKTRPMIHLKKSPHDVQVSSRCQGMELLGSLRCTNLTVSWDGAAWVTEMYKSTHSVMGWGRLGH